mmetsp:Transcript_29400/g.53947  ORF Transcript_29400/g.53947 Transcript_29400/m.53947 type:complete len:235 (-) Transcript_29400:389-1093(-)|eukprot:CAMPEP_0175052056 /NCGR_PEP_ID=MMETSP0052_2-20121109/8149_1 /TAXON_ID=51329 ORGANISM="Polytomella parva, Strain SAG 63-3" /NCGR_SAMPLE_ID=MMETSP0052_2 /ASSEMBLY_ACC=CAM_ASM_000194 /LENGTH=234 /DNA_ID=CAMNT_0016316421 /DNA_START=101 /DNA_END=805 /DNA_ORIENTATION=+
MTTAHRPTWAPAKGHEEQGGMRIFAPSKQVSAKNLPGHLTLKFRQEGQGSVAEILKKDIRAELEEKEHKHFSKKKNNDFEEKKKKDLLLLESAPSISLKTLVPRAADADDADPDDSNDENDDDDDDEEEDRLLRLELERIKKERAEEAAKRAEEEAKRVEEAKREEALRSNPLLANQASGNASDAEVSFGIKKRWYEDVVFRNQSRGEPKAQKRFVNDTIRSDFHRRFLEKYVR